MDINLSQVRGIGPARLKALQKAGILTIRQLLLCMPASYRDLTVTRPLNSLWAGETAAVRVTLVSRVAETRVNKLTISKAYVEDETERMAVVWYNQPWIKQNLREGQELLLYGRCEARGGALQLSSPTIEREAVIRPIYRPLAGIPAGVFGQCISAALTVMEGQWPDELPQEIREEYELCERNFAMRNAHQPSSREALATARRRLAFEELLLYQTALWLMRGSRAEGIVIPCTDEDVNAYWGLLAFSPTNAQRRVLEEIVTDLNDSAPMARLVQGDVGCGKTAIAFGAMYLAAQRGFQSAMMAPTEILAQQHYDHAKALFEPLGITVGLLTGSMTAKQHRVAHEAIAQGAYQIVIGTHALITPDVEYQNLGLVITDEQHRFGVKQRTQLSMKGSSPNVLVMSATPIPRTLSLILYGDLDISIVDELPPGRKPIKTRIVPEGKRMDMYTFLRRVARAGRQIYIVCPLVEESEAVDAISAESVYADLTTQYLPDLRIGLAHGKMNARAKEEVLAAFYRGETDVLVSTTVIEVGVNVPNATVMVIENAERFGLAQLHQLRGRVGRGAEESWCFLLADKNERLTLMTQTQDGFLIAQKDLELRGPGEVFGQKQSGPAFEGLKLAGGDTQILKESHDAARNILKRPDTKTAKTIIQMAEETYQEKFSEIAMN